MNITFPRLLTEKEAAERLGCSLSTIRRERKRCRIGYLFVRKRVRYTEKQLIDYLMRQEVDPCRDQEISENPSSEISGYPSGQIAQHGVALGLTQLPDKRAAHLLAQRTFGKRS